jgi:hypothetical protein
MNITLIIAAFVLSAKIVYMAVRLAGPVPNRWLLGTFVFLLFLFALLSRHDTLIGSSATC